VRAQRSPLLCVALLVSACTDIPPSIVEEPKSEAVTVEGPNSEAVWSLINAVDKGDFNKINSMLVGVKFAHGQYKSKLAIRQITVSDIPPSRNDECDLKFIRGVDDTVDAHWECHVRDMALHREFIFQQGKLKEVRNIFVPLG
jgi:hypothetical protein